jgi:hypothetical protein
MRKNIVDLRIQELRQHKNNFEFIFIAGSTNLKDSELSYKNQFLTNSDA